MIERTVLREQVKDVLLQRIVRGELKPGERLVETRIASELGTSQAPVREALRDLELLRMVESEPFRGARVRAFGDDELVEVYPVRAALEELAGKLATKRLDGDVAVLETRGRRHAGGGEGRRPERARPARHRLPPRDGRGGGEPRARAVLEVARRRGADHDLALRDVRRAARRGREARPDPRRDSRGQAGRGRPRGAEARRGVRRIARRRAKAAGR